MTKHLTKRQLLLLKSGTASNTPTPPLRHAPTLWAGILRVGAVVATFTLVRIRLTFATAYLVYYFGNGEKIADHFNRPLTAFDIGVIVALVYGFRHALESIRELLEAMSSICAVMARLMQRLDHMVRRTMARLGI
jgi:hypothetical protein